MAKKLSLSQEGSGEGVAVSATLTNDESQLRLQLSFNTTSLLQLRRERERQREKERERPYHTTLRSYIINTVSVKDIRSTLPAISHDIVHITCIDIIKSCSSVIVSLMHYLLPS